MAGQGERGGILDFPGKAPWEEGGFENHHARKGTRCKHESYGRQKPNHVRIMEKWSQGPLFHWGLGYQT